MWALFPGLTSLVGFLSCLTIKLGLPLLFHICAWGLFLIVKNEPDTSFWKVYSVKEFVRMSLQGKCKICLLTKGFCIFFRMFLIFLFKIKLCFTVVPQELLLWPNSAHFQRSSQKMYSSKSSSILKYFMQVKIQSNNKKNTLVRVKKYLLKRILVFLLR